MAARGGGKHGRSARVALLRKRLYETLVRQRSGFQDTLGQASVAKTVCHLSPRPPGKDGYLPAEAVEGCGLEPDAERLERPRPQRHGPVQDALERGDVLLPGRSRGSETRREPNRPRGVSRDDPDIWKDNDLEVLFGLKDESNTAYQILINDRVVFSDNKNQAGALDWDWSSGAKVRVERTSAGWTVEMALALERLGKELIPNGSFEKTGTGDQPFAGWTVYHYPEGQGSVRGAGSTAHRDEVTRWDGKTSLRCEGGNEASPFYTVSIYHYPRGLKPDTRYRFRCRVKTEDVKVRTSGHKGVYVNFYVPVVHRFDPNPGLTGSGDWRTIEYTVRTAKEFGDAPKFYFILKFQEATGKAWFDAVSLREILSE